MRVLPSQSSGFLTVSISGIFPISGRLISRFSWHRVLRIRHQDIFYVPISSVSRYRDIKTRHRLSNTRYRDQYRDQYRVSRYRHVQNTDINVFFIPPRPFNDAAGRRRHRDFDLSLDNVWYGRVVLMFKMTVRTDSGELKDVECAMINAYYDYAEDR